MSIELGSAMTKGMVRVLVKGDGDAAACSLASNEGGTKLQRGLAALLTERYGGGNVDVSVTHQSRPLAPELASSSDWLGPDAPDLVVLSLYPDLLQLEELSEFAPAMTKIVRDIHETGAQVAFINASTVEPDDNVSNYFGLTTEPFSLRAQRLNLDLLRLSVAEGISIVDVDRLFAEFGAADEVEAPLVYSERGCEALCLELVRVIEERGVFDQHRAEAVLLRVELPYLLAGVEKVRIEAWHAAEGDLVGYGQPLCEVVTQTAQSLVRAKDASSLASKKLKTTERRTVKLTARFMLTAAEPVRVHKLIASSGDVVGQGDQLCLVVRSKSEDSAPPDLVPHDGNLPRMRLVARLLDPSEPRPFEPGEEAS